MPLTNRVLADLAAAFGISTEFWDWKGRLTEVDDATVVGILAGMGVDASTDEAAHQVDPNHVKRVVKVEQRPRTQHELDRAAIGFRTRRNPHAFRTAAQPMAHRHDCL